MTRLYWDFRGGQAHGTAAHFQRHLVTFLEAREIMECPTGLEAYSAVHSAVFCDVGLDARPILVASLKPHRARTLAAGD